jgi:uncharacterized membrane protein
MRKSPWYFIILLIIAWLAIPSITVAQSADEPVVQAVLFYSPTCPHCHYVITEVLIPMVDDYGHQLQLLGIDTSQPEGGLLYQAAIERYQIPNQRRGVPTLIVSDMVLVGSGEIPEQFPSLVEEGLASGGIGWPDIPGLEQVLPSEVEQGPSPTPTLQITATSTPTSGPQATVVLAPTATSQATVTPTHTPTVAPTATPIPAALVAGHSELPSTEIEMPPPDPLGFTLAGVVLAGMVAVLGYAILRMMPGGQRLFQLDRNPVTYAHTLTIPLLSLLGLGVATYLAYVEITHVEAICGPVGECNLVQSSPYAQLLGIPVAVLGILNYLAVGVLWAGQRYPVAQLAYLTLLELFVIHAICAWCLSSAVITTLLLLLIAVPITGHLSRAGQSR